MYLYRVYESILVREEGGRVACPFCGEVVQVQWDPEGYPILLDPCPHLAGAEWDGEPGRGEFLAVSDEPLW